MIDRTHVELYAYTALRILVGVFLVCHGIGHVFGVFKDASPVGSQEWIGGIIEVLLGSLVAVGFYTRLAAFVLAGQMAVAYFQFHWKLHFGGWRFLPIVNKGELAAVYCFVLLLIWARGAGQYSLDRRRGHGG
jgi:putative oxidoreductase